jgi:hypothetical protein
MGERYRLVSSSLGYMQKHREMAGLLTEGAGDFKLAQVVRIAPSASTETSKKCETSHENVGQHRSKKNPQRSL